MGEIKLNAINTRNGSVEYEFEISEDLKKFFSGSKLSLSITKILKKFQNLFYQYRLWETFSQ